MTTQDMNDNILEEIKNLKQTIGSKSSGVCEHHGTFNEQIKTMKDDIGQIKACLLGNGKVGLKEEVSTHLANHKQFGGLSKYIIASIVLPLIAIVISIYAIKMNTVKSEEKIMKIIEKNIKQSK